MAKRAFSTGRRAMESDAPKLRINPPSTEGLEHWIDALHNPETRETQIQLMERTIIFPTGVVVAHLMLRDKDWCAIGEWIAINLWSGDPEETGMDEPIITTGKIP
jgi:hypothetical protein